MKVYNNGTDWICELWGASTKHPDATYKFSEWNNKTDLFSDEEQIFQWLLWIASCRQWPFHAREIAEFALENYYNWG